MNQVSLTRTTEPQVLIIDFTAGEKKMDQNSLAMTSCRSYPPNLTSRCWCESSTSFGLERSGIVKGQHGSTKCVCLIHSYKSWSILVL